MKINRNLNIAIPISSEKGNIYAHSAPISRSVFEENYLELGKVFSQCFESISNAHLALSAPQLAYPALKSISKAAGTWDRVQFSLLNEIIRLTNIIHPTENGYESLPMDVAVKRGILDEDTESEVLSSLVFFTAISRVAPMELKTSFLEMAGSLRNWELTSSNSMEYMNSLKTLNPIVPTGKKAKTSSVTA